MGKHVVLLPSNTGKMEQLSLTIKRINPDYPIDMINPDSLKADEIRCRVAEAISEAREKSVLRREAMLRYAESARQDYSVLFSELCTK